MYSKKGPRCNYGPTNTYIVTSPIGDMEILSCPKGLHNLHQVDTITDENFQPEPGKQVILMSQLYNDNGYTYKPALQCIDWLQAYFHPQQSPSEPPTPPWCPSISREGTFTHTVWSTLQSQIQFGNTISYGRLAKLCGNEKACRAVGQAMRTNPLQLLMPCHRVIQENGQLGNYSSGRRIKVKQWLLQHEGVIK
ncbi:hypothetical protein ACJMK2_034627 [Sinanodonta woodiana]|uniref:Methylated-DNA--protein-cysteine methyltransferase n=1 Tax=Sinanodonta woodiana TaxID=1069815 RepID=A0ABD3WS84_SINWO